MMLVAVFLFLPLSSRSEDTGFLDGALIPQDFIPFCAPQNTMQLPFWGSSSNGTQLATIEPENKWVKAGEVIATFQFRQEGAKDTLDQRFPLIKAKNEEMLIKMKKEIDRLEFAFAGKELDTRKAELDLQKKPGMAKIKQDLLDCDFAILKVEVKALQHKLAAARQNLVIQKANADRQEKIWTTYFDIYEATKARTIIKAPEDGILFYPILDKQGRKVRIGDRLNSGVHFLSLLRSDRSILQFNLPERSFPKVAVGDEVRITGEKGRREFTARVASISFFPQLVGDLELNFKLPNAWEKRFVVKAEILGTATPSLFGGVKVKLLK